MASNVQTLRKIAPNFCGLLRKANLYISTYFLPTLCKVFSKDYTSKNITLGQDSVIAMVYRYRVAYVEVPQDFQFS